MTKITVYGEAMNLCRNPWREVGMGKKANYLRRPAPWDKRRMGTAALSPKQKAANEAFTKAVEDAKAECPKTGRMSTNVCRVTKIGSALRGKSY